ncbi:MAG: hypothetical protein HKN47_15410 [Pirellulaceae bacterium]|nr:hypothetical protein [Pirellulaceae bacterium]
MLNRREIECMDGSIEIRPQEDRVIVESSSHSRQSVTLSMTDVQCRELIDALTASLECDNWSVWRKGDDGNPVRITTGLTQDAADAMVYQLELSEPERIHWASQRQHGAQIAVDCSMSTL